MDGRPTWTDCDEAGDYVVPNVLSPRDLVFRPDNMDETVPHTFASHTFCHGSALLFIFLFFLSENSNKTYFCLYNCLLYYLNSLVNWVDLPTKIQTFHKTPLLIGRLIGTL